MVSVIEGFHCSYVIPFCKLDVFALVRVLNKILLKIHSSTVTTAPEPEIPSKEGVVTIIRFVFIN